ncbi:AAA family ATPase [Microvirga tunisiensis]|nr:AAA family ATPase [Microvirga tunisiensis]
MTCVGQEHGMTGLVRHLAEDQAFAGIGYAKAARLVEAFGADLPRLLSEGDPTPFVPIVGVATAATLIEAWRESQARNDIMVWLDENGLDSRLASRILRLWGADSARRIRKHPYALMALADWHAVDATAQRLGVALDDPARQVAAVEAVLYERLQRQHTWTIAREVEIRVGKLLRMPQEAARRAVALAEQVGAALPLRGGFQPAGAAMMEQYVTERILDMLEGPATDDLIAREVGNTELETWLDGTRGAIGVDLNEEQRAAVRLAVQSRFGLVLGGAGVGKTTVLRAVCAACESFGRVVHLMALAGRAAVRMREATGRPSSTIAAFLKACETDKVTLGPESLVVIDESSMVDLPNLYRLLRHLPDGCRLLLVGDEAQLGPIGFGLTLHAFTEIHAIPKVRLTRIYRHSEASGIPIVAASVRNGVLPSIPSRIDAGDGVILVPTVKAPTADDVVDIVATLGGFTDDLRILSPVKAGDSGTLALNASFHAIMSPGRSRFPGRAFALGEPVIYGKNDYRRDLRNGSLGTVVGVDRGVLTVDFDGGFHEFAGPALDELALAYAITVHKAQGSQFRNIVMPVVPTRILDRSLIYTALTRASERVVLVGQRDILENAVIAMSAAGQRETGFTLLSRSV